MGALNRLRSPIIVINILNMRSLNRYRDTEAMAPDSVVSQMVRLAETDRPRIEIAIDGKAALAMEGDTLLVAVLTNAGRLRRSEFGDGDRAGFCLMGACQDCWVWMESGERLRACTTLAEPNMRIMTGEPDGLWPRHG